MPDLNQLLHDTAPSPSAPVDTDAIRRGIRGRRRRRQFGTGLLSVAVIALVGLGTATLFDPPPSRPIIDQPSPPVDPTPTPPTSVVTAPGWQPLPTPPIAPRRDAAAVTLDDGRVVLLGGSSTPSCGPTARCAADPEYTRDGAVLDPIGLTWQVVPAAPVDLAHPTAVAVGDQILVRAADNDLLALDGLEQWRTLTSPSTIPGPIVAMGERVVAVVPTHETDRGREPDQVYDPATDTWSALPRDPLPDAFDRSMVWTGTRLVLLASALVPNPGSDGPTLVLAAAYDPVEGTWEELPDGEVAALGGPWVAVDGLVVNASAGTVDGGDVNPYDRPYANGGILDPMAGTWEALPPINDADAGLWLEHPVAGGDRLVAGHRAPVLDVAARAWFELPPPPVAADEGAAATWTGDRLVVIGGERYADGPALLDEAWIWTPPDAVTPSPDGADREVLGALEEFARDPSPDTFDRLPLADEVALGLGSTIHATVPGPDLVDAARWVLDVEEYAGFSGPFSALDHLGSGDAREETVGPHVHCAGPPLDPPPGLADARQVSAQRTDATSCIDWWSVDVFVRNGEIVAVTLGLFGP